MAHYLTTQEAATELGVSAQTVRDLIRKQIIRATLHGRDWLIAPEDLAPARDRPKVGRPAATKA